MLKSIGKDKLNIISKSEIPTYSEEISDKIIIIIPVINIKVLYLL